MDLPATYESWKNPFSTSGLDLSAEALQLLSHSDYAQQHSFVAGPYGFFAFNPTINLLAALTLHTKNVAKQSCGKCTPCRTGLQLVVSKLEKLATEGGQQCDLDELATLSKHISQTSLCGLGQTALIPLYNAIEKYSPVLLANMSHPQAASRALLDNHFITTAPCMLACPAHVDVPRYIGHVVNGRYDQALQTLLEKYPFAGSCGRVCTRPCESACQRKYIDQPVAILDIKRFIADQQKDYFPQWVADNRPKHEKPQRIAIIGAGPSGLSCAYHLRLQGYQVDIFEQEKTPGGMANVAIPSYRLPKNILYREANLVAQLGVVIHYGVALGKDFTLQQLKQQGFAAIYVAIGAGKGTAAGIANEDTVKSGYQLGLNFLHDVQQQLQSDCPNQSQVKGKVVVVGGGNVAMDCVRSAVRLGAAEVHLVYRRTREQMPADSEEVIAAEQEGVIFHFLANPTGLVIDQQQALTAIKLVKMQLGEADKSGRCRPMVIANSEYLLSADWFIPAIGQRIDTQLFADGLDGRAIDLTSWGTIAIDKQTYNSTSHAPYLFAGGDCAAGPTIMIAAINDGSRAAQRISEMLEGKEATLSDRDKLFELASTLTQLPSLANEQSPCTVARSHPVALDPSIRISTFAEVVTGNSKHSMLEEAARCLRCYGVYSALTQTSEEA